MREVQPFLWLGWIFACAVSLGVLVGWWLDKKLGTNHVFLLIGAFLGIAAAFVHFFKTVLNWNKKK